MKKKKKKKKEVQKFPFPKRNTSKTSFDYNNNLRKLANEMHSIEKTLLQHFLQENNFRATYIILDEENNGLVRISSCTKHLKFQSHCEGRSDLEVRSPELEFKVDFGVVRGGAA